MILRFSYERRYKRQGVFNRLSLVFTSFVSSDTSYVDLMEKVMNPIDPRVDPLVPHGSRAVVIAETQDEYIDLPSVRTPPSYDSQGRMLNPGYVITRWELTNEERVAILNGEDIYITIVSGGSINPLFATEGQVNWT